MNKKCVYTRDCFINNGKYYAIKISVFDNGTIETSWFDRYTDKADFIHAVNSGWITVDIPDGGILSICDQQFKVSQYFKGISKEEFIKEVLDVVHQTANNPSSGKLCYRAYQNYLNEPTEDNKEKLRIAYYDMPAHKRRFVLGDQDRKDYPILAIINEQGADSDKEE